MDRQRDALAGAALLVAAVAALVWANVAHHSYESLWSHHADLDVLGQSFHLTRREWVNSGLMTIFFFVVGLEIKRELVTGDLRDPRVAALPAIGALGGMIAPAAIYVALNAGGRGADGWGIPIATDIAFVLAVLAVLGPRVPSTLRLFVLALAVADDIGAIAVIAVFYSSDLHGTWLLGAAATVVLMIAMRRLGVWSWWAYIPPAVVLWVCLEHGGVEAAIAGVVLGLLTPARPPAAERVLIPLEHRFAPWSAFAVAPLFALANAGVRVGGGVLGDALTSRVTIGIVLGLVVGKTLGISLATALGVHWRLGRLPAGVDARLLVGAAAIAGIGFTVSLFVAELSFSDAGLLDEAKIGVLAASLLAGAIGATMLAWTHRRSESSSRSSPT